MKPKPNNYYNWDEAWTYLKEKYGFNDVVDMKDELRDANMIMVGLQRELEASRE